jgi:hypothetical protein
VKLVGVGTLHAAFLNESRTRRCVQRSVQEIRVGVGRFFFLSSNTEQPSRLGEIACPDFLLRGTHERPRVLNPLAPETRIPAANAGRSQGHAIARDIARFWTLL